jgi:hypothetical protein
MISIVPGTTLLAVIGKSHTEIEAWSNSHRQHLFGTVDHFVSFVNGNRFGGYGSICQKILTYARSIGVEAVGFVHGDTGFPRGFNAFFEAAFEPNKVVGIVGASKGRTNVWCSNPDPRPMIHCLDGCAVFFRADAQIDFDPATFDGHHACVEDLCLTARERGMQLVIPYGVAEHAGTTHMPPGANRANEAWMADYHHYRLKLLKKHPKIEFSMT